MTSSAIERARIFSDAKLAEVRKRIDAVVPAGVAVVACGSYARREASPASDFDYFSIAPGEGSDLRTWDADLKRTIGTTVGVEPAKDGAFAAVEHAERMVRNIGGQFDDNAKLTRRMLFLLEGVPLSAERDAEAVRRAILDRYLRAGAEDGLALFLLDDVIRYYRTIAVDYEFKTSEGERPKPWGLRNVKLMFSRKLLYASGVFSVAAARAADPADQAETLASLLSLPPLPRMEAVCGAAAIAPLLARYDAFLTLLSDRGLRATLEALTPADRDHATFLAIKREGRAFAGELVGLFRTVFEADHPIHRAMLF